MKRVAWWVGIGLLSITVFPSLSVVGAQDGQPNWLNTETITVTKTAELPVNTEPFSMGANCTPTDFQIGYKNDGQTLHGCAITLPFGTVANGFVLKGSNGTLTHRISSNGFFLPYSAHGLVTYVNDTNSYGDFIRIGNTAANPGPIFSKDQNGGYYAYNLTPEKYLLDDYKQPIRFGALTIAYSPNGEWMVVKVLNGPVMLYDTKTYTPKTVAWLRGYHGFGYERGGDSMSVSNDGRYIAVTSNLAQPDTKPLQPLLQVYDTTTCQNQWDYLYKPIAPKECQSREIWNGALGTQKTGSVLAAAPGLEYPRHLRFLEDGSLSFDSVYERTSATNFKVGHYVIPAGGYVPRVPIKLLALGDSYISGEGAFSYVTGTDTDNNKCHNSTASYPYLLGAQYADGGYHSVACSGAVTEDINPQEPDVYRGQVKDRIFWNKRNRDLITNNYLPGYAGQVLFLPIFNPNTILLSIGGNDIGFKDIITRCVLSMPNDPCFSRQSERAGLLKNMYSQHSRLTEVYSKIMSQNPKDTKLYVVGYPQVINPTGSCGINVHFDDQERQFAVQLIDKYNAVIKNAAESVGAFYVNNQNALTGHRLCDVTNDGVNGLTNGDDKGIGLQIGSTSYGIGIGNESYHPTAGGHRLLAASIDAQTEHLTKRPAAATGRGPLQFSEQDEFITSGQPDSEAARRITFQNLTNQVVDAVKDQIHVFIDKQTQGALYRLVFHSEEVEVATGIVPDNGIIDLTVTVPKIPPGVHSLNLYTTDADNNPISISQNIFITASSNDYDGDGVPNDNDPMPYVNETGVIVAPESPQTEPDSGVTPTPDLSSNTTQPTGSNTSTGSSNPPGDTSSQNLTDTKPVSPVVTIPTAQTDTNTTPHITDNMKLSTSTNQQPKVTIARDSSASTTTPQVFPEASTPPLGSQPAAAVTKASVANTISSVPNMGPSTATVTSNPQQSVAISEQTAIDTRAESNVNAEKREVLAAQTTVRNITSASSTEVSNPKKQDGRGKIVGYLSGITVVIGICALGYIMSKKVQQI